MSKKIESRSQRLQKKEEAMDLFPQFSDMEELLTRVLAQEEQLMMC
jgi:hypothetical protein